MSVCSVFVCGYKFSFQLSKYQGAQLLAYMVNVRGSAQLGGDRAELLGIIVAN